MTGCMHACIDESDGMDDMDGWLTNHVTSLLPTHNPFWPFWSFQSQLTAAKGLENKSCAQHEDLHIKMKRMGDEEHTIHRPSFHSDYEQPERNKTARKETKLTRTNNPNIAPSKSLFLFAWVGALGKVYLLLRRDEEF